MDHSHVYIVMLINLCNFMYVIFYTNKSVTAIVIISNFNFLLDFRCTSRLYSCCTLYAMFHMSIRDLMPMAPI